MLIDRHSAPDHVMNHIADLDTLFVVRTSRVGFLEPLLALIVCLTGVGISVNVLWKLVAPLTRGQEVVLETTPHLIVVYPNDWSPLTFYFVVFGLVIFIGLILAVISVKWFMDRVPWVVGTKDKVIFIYRRRIASWTWEHFNANHVFKNRGAKGSLTLWMKTSMYRDIKGPKYKKDHIKLIGIPFPEEIKDICLERIDACTEEAKE